MQPHTGAMQPQSMPLGAHPQPGMPMGGMQTSQFSGMAPQFSGMAGSLPNPYQSPPAPAVQFTGAPQSVPAPKTKRAGGKKAPGPKAPYRAIFSKTFSPG
eukprot:9549862-Karenia_brevis.AAC.1